MALDFQLSDEHKLVAGSMKACLDQFAGRQEEFRTRILKDKQFPQELWDAICDTGLMGTVIPEQYGGNGMGLLAATLGMEALAHHGFSNALLMLGMMDATAILRHGSEQMKQRYLPKIASGEEKWCFAITEPDAGSNAFRMRTLATRDGGDYVIEGTKVFITGADVADRMLLVCRTTSAERCQEQGAPKTFGLALFCVDTKAKGIDLKPIPTRGIEGLTQFMVHFEGLRVPAADLVGDPDMGSLVMFNSLNPERIFAAASACGMAEFCLDRAIRYANERNLFGKTPIGAYQGVQHPLAEAKIEIDAARLFYQRAAWGFDQGIDNAQVGIWANMAKWKASRAGMFAVDRAIQTLGGYGFSEEYEIIYFFEAMRLLQIAPINNELILSSLAEHAFGLPRSY